MRTESKINTTDKRESVQQDMRRLASQSGRKHSRAFQKRGDGRRRELASGLGELEAKTTRIDWRPSATHRVTQDQEIALNALGTLQRPPSFERLHGCISPLALYFFSRQLLQHDTVQYSVFPTFNIIYFPFSSPAFGFPGGV